jgi:acid stress-induced BolA-like protein IbaG/YrbA
MTPADIGRQIEAALPGSVVRVQSEDNVHFSALVIASQFDGLRTLQRHQLVYRALGAAVGAEIHALSLDTPTPDEWASRGAGQAS